MRKSISTLITTIMIILLQGISYADTTEDVILTTSIPATISITKGVSADESKTVTAATGVHTGLSSVFTLQTNADDTDFDIVLSSSCEVGGSLVPAFAQNGSVIVFTHTVRDTTTGDVDNAKNGGSKNFNVIAYPFAVTPTNPMTAVYKASFRDKDDSFQILLNELKEGSVTCTIGGTPVSGTYNIGQDEAGVYKATVTLTAIGK